MALVKVVAGYRAMFVVGPLSAAILVLATYGLGRRLGSPDMGVIAAWLVACSPSVISNMLVPMSDIPAAAGMGAGRLPAVRTESGLRGRRGAGRRHRHVDSSQPRARSRRDGCLADLQAVARPDASITALPAHRRVHRGACPRSGDTGRPVLVALRVTAPLRLRTAWGLLRRVAHPAESSELPLVARRIPDTFAYLGLVGLALAIRWLWPHTPDRSMVVALGAFLVALWGQYAAFQLLSSWVYLRYVVASWPALMLGVAAVALLPLRWAGKPAIAVTADCDHLGGCVDVRFYRPQGRAHRAPGRTQVPGGRDARTRAHRGGVGRHRGAALRVHALLRRTR